MSNRLRALEILRRARDLLADRLTERIVDGEEALLDDARGDSYLGDIDHLFDHFGSKLAHLNQMINNLPQETETAVSSAPFSTGDYLSIAAADAALADDVIVAHPASMTGSLIVSPPSLPSPWKDEELPVVVPSFAVFAGQIRAEDLLDAARTLSILLGISEARGMQCVRNFHRRWRDDESYLTKALQLRAEILGSSYNNALMLLAECFGLVGIEAIGALQVLRTRLLEGS